jgi:hypothetical protein
VEEKQPDQYQHRRHAGERVLENQAHKAGGVDFLVVGDGFNHEIGAIADVSIGAEKDRPDADGEDVMVESLIAEQEGNLDFLRATLPLARAAA